MNDQTAAGCVLEAINKRAILNGADLLGLMVEHEQLVELLGRLVDHETGPCRIDCHGYCQEHPGGGHIPCTTATARELLRRVRTGVDESGAAS